MSDASPVNWLPTTSLPNARTANGLPTMDGLRMGPTLIRSADPRLADAHDRHMLLQTYNVKCVADLRSSSEVQMFGSAMLEVENVRFDLSLPNEDDGLLHHLKPEILTGWGPALVSLLARNEGALLVHCQAGFDRTGLVCAFLETLAGATRSAVQDDWAATIQAVPALYEIFRKDEFVQASIPQGITRLESVITDPVSYEERLRSTAGSVYDYLGGPLGARDRLTDANADPADIDTAIERLLVH